MKGLNLVLAHAAVLGAAIANNKYFDDGRFTAVPEEKTKQDLPRWDVNGHIIFAKDEKTAIKYAKKRGLWTSGAIVKPIETK